MVRVSTAVNDVELLEDEVGKLCNKGLTGVGFTRLSTVYRTGNFAK